MELITPNTTIDFVGKTKWALLFSLTLMAISALSLIIRGGPRYGIDFEGGTLVQIKFSTKVTISEVRNAVGALNIEDISVQEFGEKDANEYLISMKKTTEELQGLSDKVRVALQNKFGAESLEVRRVEVVGPKVGKDLREKGMLAIIFSLIGMLIYIWFRFELRFGVGAVLCLFHDVTITVGAFSILNKPIDLIIIAALLTIIGYSINDTIVVCDRVRENIKKMSSKSLSEIINVSLNQTLSRTILTNATVIMVLIVLFFFGGEVLHDFAFSLLVGCFFGTYSTVYIAGPLIIYWEKFFPKKKRR
jgi:preprotein translocase subunit SecF